MPCYLSLSDYPEQNTEIKRNEQEMKDAEEPLVPDRNVMLHIGARYKYVGMLGSGHVAVK